MAAEIPCEEKIKNAWWKMEGNVHLFIATA
jgi:hypothetical protein